MLMPDEVRLRRARRALDGSHVPAVLALERDAAWAGPSEPVWRLPSVAAATRPSLHPLILRGAGRRSGPLRSLSR